VKTKVILIVALVGALGTVPKRPREKPEEKNNDKLHYLVTLRMLFSTKLLQILGTQSICLLS